MGTAYQFGQYVYNRNGLSRVVDTAINAKSVYAGASIAAGGLSAASSAALGLNLPTALAVAGTLYGAKQIYDGLKDFF